MDSATLALWLVGVLWALFALWVWASARGMEHMREMQGALKELHGMGMKKTDELERRTAGVEALLVSTVGQETEDFCRQMDAIMDRMEKPEAKQEPAPKLTLSKEHCGKFGKKGGTR